MACDAATTEQHETAELIDTDAALGALLLLLLRNQRRLWRPAKEDLTRRLSAPGVVPAHYEMIAQTWLGQWATQYRSAAARIRQVVEPAIGRLARVVGTQTDRQLVQTGYQAQIPVELSAVHRKTQQVVDALVRSSIDQAVKTAETAASVLRQSALAELPAGRASATIEEITPAKRGPQFAARDADGILVAAIQRAAFKAAGVSQATWVTRRDNKVRPTHRARDGRVYDVEEGLGGIFPGSEPNCRCIGVPVPRR